MSDFGITRDGQSVARITLRAGDLTVCLITYGAIVQDVRLAGVDHSLTLGSEDLADYEDTMPYHGALIGPIANRISTARVRIEGMDYELERNQDGRIHLHSGSRALNRRVWDVVAVSESAATLACDLGDGECGLPGNRRILAQFTVSPDNALTLDLTGTTDAATPMNLANHSYWTLDGGDSWEGQRLRIAADRYLPTHPDNTPTGEIAPVEGTDVDFRAPARPRPGRPALDHNFCLSDERTEVRPVVTLRGNSGLTLEMETDQPGLQVFDGRPDYRALVFEAQGWPDAPTWPDFPSIMIGPDSPYRQRTRWRFLRD